jgi:hypothetical protein
VVRALLEAGAGVQAALQYATADVARELHARCATLCSAFVMAQRRRLDAGAEVGGLEAGLVREVLALAGLEPGSVLSACRRRAAAGARLDA